MRALVLGFVLVPIVASATTDCLNGAPAAVLDDQRALASLRVNVDATCPCGGFSTAGTYRTCARGVVGAAVDGGTLRRECKSTATKTYKGAVCGTTKIACARLAPTSRTLRTCHVKAADRCYSRSGFTEAACVNETTCADVVDWTASTCVDVRQAGPFAVGVRVVTLTKQSVVDPTQTRVLDTYVWYPAPAGSGPVDPASGGVLDAPVDLSRGPYPVVMFSHGSCGLPTQSTFLWPLIASRGFVVVAPPHPGNTLAEFPSCGTTQAQVFSAVERPADIRFALDQMLAASADPLSPFAGALDPDRVGMSGHSFGGFTTYLVATQDARIKVALPMAPAIPASQPVLTMPSLTMLSSEDTYVDGQAIRDAYGRAHAPKYLVEVENTGHFAYSNNCFPSPDCNPPVNMTQDEAHAAVLHWVLPFLEVYLAGDTSFTPFLAMPPPPGFVYQSAP